MAVFKTRPGDKDRDDRKPRRKGRRRKGRAEKITEKGRPVIATTTAPAPQAQVTDAGDEAGVFSSGAGYAPAYHYHVDQQTYPYQVEAQLAETAAAAQ